MNKNKRILISGLLFLWSIILLLSSLKSNHNESFGLFAPKTVSPKVQSSEIMAYSSNIEHQIF